MFLKIFNFNWMTDSRIWERTGVKNAEKKRVCLGRKGLASFEGDQSILAELVSNSPACSADISRKRRELNQQSLFTSSTFCLSVCLSVLWYRFFFILPNLENCKTLLPQKLKFKTQTIKILSVSMNFVMGVFVFNFYEFCLF